ncbi:hypothetical protein ACIGV8_20800 [Streptomyces albidoflavus]
MSRRPSTSEPPLCIHPGGATGDDTGAASPSARPTTRQRSRPPGTSTGPGVPAAPARARELGHTHLLAARARSFHRFGRTTDDYTPKPAFDLLRALVAPHGS